MVLPVRRRLMCLAVCYLAGVVLAQSVCVSAAYTGVFCALLAVCAVVLYRRRKSALLCMALAMLLLGVCRGGAELYTCDAATAYGVTITGRVCAIERERRVYLEDVMIDGQTRLSRRAVVTLMIDEDAPEAPGEICVGQTVTGTGRLFAPETPRNPGGVNKRIQAICDGYELSGYILPGWTAQGKACFSLRESFRRMRVRLLGRMQQLFGDQAPLFSGIMLGERSAIDREVTAAMRLTGTAHILTVSGLHLSLIAMAFGSLIRRSGLSGFSGFCMLAVLLFFFGGLTGFAPGTVRALIMTLLRECSRLRGRRYEPLTVLSAAALGMTLVRPLWVMDASFQFSFFVVLGIQLLSRGVREALSRGMRGPVFFERMLDMTAISVSAQLAAIPMQLQLYGYIPLFALPMNLLAGVFVQLALLGAWICVAIGFAFPAAALFPARLLGLSAQVFERMSVWAASFDAAILRLPAPGYACVVLFAGLMLLASRQVLVKKGRKRLSAMIALLMIALYLPAFSPAARYVQLDVGQGDAAVIRRGRRAVLVDVGPADSYEALRYLRHEGLFPQAVILSHLDEDHAGALGVLLDSEIGIPAIVMADGAMDHEVSSAVENALDRALEADVSIRTVQQGDRMSVSGMRMDVLSPTQALRGSNERSLLIRAEMEGITLLLTGDLPSGCEPVILPECDVLKVAHHGSKYATSDALIAMTQPEIAVISVGADNPYGHPGKRVLESLEAIGADVLRTDRDGCITLWLQDGSIRKECYFP